MTETVTLRFTHPNGRVWQRRYQTTNETATRAAAARRGGLSVR